MSKDEHFMAAEAVRIIDDVIAVKVLWLNPPGKQSTRVSFNCQMLSEDKRGIVDRNLIVGWKCQRCSTVLFGTCVKDLMHLPCCAEYECVAGLAGHAT